MRPVAARDGRPAEGDGVRRPVGHALLEEALAPALALDPLRVRGGRDHQERRDHAAREGDDLRARRVFLNDQATLPITLKWPSGLLL